MPMLGGIQSIEDYEEIYGKFSGLAVDQYGLGAGMRKWTGLKKSFNAPLLTTTGGAFQFIVGPQLWVQLNTEANLFAALAKKEWTESGIRVESAAPTTKIRGVAESTSPVGNSVLPSFVQYQPTVKLMETPFDGSLAAVYLGGRGEEVTWEQFRESMGVWHKKGINTTLNTKVDSNTAGNNFTSLDMIASSQSESAFITTNTNSDIFGLDRHTAASWADANVLHNSGVNRSLSRNLINTTQRVTFNATGDYNPGNYFWYTGLDTYQRINELVESIQRLDEKDSTFSPVNGVELGFAGGNKGVRVQLGVYNGSPIVLSQDTPADGISRLYYVHKDHTHFRVVQPTVYREAGISTGQELLTQKYGDLGLYYTAGELVSNFFASVGKLRDLN